MHAFPAMADFFILNRSAMEHRAICRNDGCPGMSGEETQSELYLTSLNDHFTAVDITC